MKKPFPAYRGDDAYVFVCYSHADADVVFPEISELNQHGINIWYDEGISAGDNWRDSLANAIVSAERLVLYVSRASTASENCMKEVSYAVEHKIPVICVYLERADLPPGLNLYLGDLHAITLDTQNRTEQLLQQLGATPVPKKVEKTRRKLRWYVPLTVMVVLTASWLFWISRPPIPTSASIGVLPFDKIGSEDTQYFADGVSETILNSLARLPDIKVAARTSSFLFRDKPDLQEIAAALGVRFIVDGSVQRIESQVRVSAYMIDTASNETIWSYDSGIRPQSEIFAMQDDVARAVLEALPVELTPENAIANIPEVQFEAYDHYLLARHLWRQRGEESIRSSIDYFQRSLALEPEFALGWTGLASAYLTLPAYSRDATSAHGNARDMAEKALALDPSLGEPHSILASIALDRNDWLEAEVQYRQAFINDPDNPVIHSWYSEFMADVGKIRESFEHARRSADLDPLAPQALGGVAWGHFALGRYNQALVIFEKAMAINNLMFLWRGQFVSLIDLGDLELAKAALQNHPSPEIAHVDATYLDGMNGSVAPPTAAATILSAIRQRQIGRRDGVLYLIRLGELDSAYLVEQFIVERNLPVQSRSFFSVGAAPFRSDFRFETLVTDLGLSAYWRQFGDPDFCSVTENSLVCDS